MNRHLLVCALDSCQHRNRCTATQPSLLVCREKNYGDFGLDGTEPLGAIQHPTLSIIGVIAVRRRGRHRPGARVAGGNARESGRQDRDRGVQTANPGVAVAKTGSYWLRAENPLSKLQVEAQAFLEATLTTARSTARAHRASNLRRPASRYHRHYVGTVMVLIKELRCPIPFSGRHF